MHEVHVTSNRRPRYGFVKMLLIVLLLCHVAYISCKVFNARMLILPESSNGTITTGNLSRDIDSTMADEVDRAAIYLERRQHLQQLCNYSGAQLSAEYLVNIPRVITVDAELPVLYCPMQKVASTFWVRLLTVIGSKGKFDNPFQITLQEKTLTSVRKLKKDMTANQMDTFMSNPFSFMFVRDPYSRLFSAYVDKVYYPNTIFWPNLINEIIDEVRVNKTHMASLSHVTFEEFIQYIVKMDSEDRPLDKHFAPMHTLCDPCALEYSFIGKLETFLQDIDYLMDMWSREYHDINITFTDFPHEAMMDDAVRHVSMLFTVAELVKNSSVEDVYSVINRGWINLKLRGYIDKDSGLPFTLQEIRNVTMNSFMDIFVNITSTIPLATERAKLQRSEALVQAYRTINTEDLERLRLFVLKDCEAFGYDDRPYKLFNRDTSFPEYNYFPDV